MGYNASARTHIGRAEDLLNKIHTQLEGKPVDTPTVVALAEAHTNIARAWIELELQEED